MVEVERTVKKRQFPACLLVVKHLREILVSKERETTARYYYLLLHTTVLPSNSEYGVCVCGGGGGGSRNGGMSEQYHPSQTNSLEVLRAIFNFRALGAVWPVSNMFPNSRLGMFSC